MCCLIKVFVQYVQIMTVWYHVDYYLHYNEIAFVFQQAHALAVINSDFCISPDMFLTNDLSVINNEMALSFSIGFFEM